MNKRKTTFSGPTGPMEDDNNEEVLNQTATTNDSADPAEATPPSPRSPEIAALVEHNYSLRDRSSFDCKHYQYMQQHADVPLHQPSELDKFRNIVSHAVLTRMSAKKGIKKHGQVAIEAIISEFHQ